MTSTTADDTVAPGVYTPGQQGFIQPGTDAWLRCITPSKIAAIIGQSRWESPYRLWHRMKGRVNSPEPQDIFAVGHAYEPAAAELWKLKNPGWKLSAAEVQYVLPDDLLGFPALVTLDRRASLGPLRRVVEMKLARDLYDWGDDFTGDCPDDYAGQVIAQHGFIMAAQAAGIESKNVKWSDTAHLIALGPFFNDRLYKIDFDAAVFEWMLRKCRKFYESLADSTPPPLDDSLATYECVRALHPEIDGETIEVSEELAFAVHDANEEYKAAEQRLRGLKSQLRATMQSARAAEMPDGRKVATRSPQATGTPRLNLARKHPEFQKGRRTA